MEDYYQYIECHSEIVHFEMEFYSFYDRRLLELFGFLVQECCDSITVRTSGQSHVLTACQRVSL